ncbi:MAG: DUF86 domain-containing protein [Candidatus Omnitrophota bacterium]|nr:DUF86 domain-containing protein [Candidatus Omnitrophota bacterium]
MSKREWKLFLEDILESIGLIEEYIDNMPFEDFSNDRKTIDAVVRNFEIIGEAAKYIPDDLKSRFQDVDWKGVAGLRNRIAHEYFGISLAIVWEIIKRELPEFKKQLQQILSDF